MAMEYQEMTRKLGDLPWPGRHGCYVVIHVKLLLFHVWVLIYTYIYWMLCDHPSRYLFNDE